MGFLSDFLLGKSPKAHFKSFDLISPTQRGGLDALIAQLQRQSPQPYTGDFTAPLSGGEKTSLAALEQRALEMASPEAQANFEGAGKTLQQLMDFEGQTADTSKYWETNVQNPLLEQFSQEILPQISRQFSGADFFSSERQGAEATAREDLLQTLTGSREKVALDAFNQSRDRALQAAGQVPGLEGAQDARTQSMIDILEAAGLPREIAQKDLDAQYQDFLRQITQNQDAMKLLAQLVLSPTMENIGIGTGGQKGELANVIKAIAAAYAASDHRFKTDIRYVFTIGPVRFYTYRYKWGAKRRLGVMAQELELVAPQLVITVNGYKFVNYGGLV